MTLLQREKQREFHWTNISRSILQGSLDFPTMSRAVEPFDFTDEVKQRAGWWGSPYYELRIVIELLLTLCCAGIAIAIFAILVSTDNTKYHDLTDNWQARPIVDIIAIPADSRCPLGYEWFDLDSSMIKEIKGGPCVCNEKVYGFQSSAAECSNEALANGCRNALFSNGVVPQSWRDASFCYFRSEQATASWRPVEDDPYRTKVSRPYPDAIGNCPSGYRRCGQRKQYEDGAVCIPQETLCPITNIQIASQDNVPRITAGWQPAGALQNGSFQLYFRREGAGELPIVDIGLAFNARHGPATARGPCLHKSDAVVVLSANQEQSWAYEAVLPRACARTDARYLQFDEILLQDYFLQQLQHQEPSCTGYSVLPLTDPAYTAARDPDYTNSGATCQAPAQQSCFLDLLPASRCNSSDAICDVAVNQNTCGAYAHAIRSAFVDTSLSLGLYFRREIPWSQSCPVHRARVSHLHYIYDLKVVFSMMWGILMTFLFGLLHNGVRLVFNVHYKLGVGYRLKSGYENIYIDGNFLFRLPSLLCYVSTWFYYSDFYGALRAVHNGVCTDPFTQSTFQYTAGLTLCAHLLFSLCIIEFALWAVACLRQAHLSKIHRTVRENALVARNARYAAQVLEVSTSSRASHLCLQDALPVSVSAHATTADTVSPKVITVPEPEQATAVLPVPTPATGVVAATRATAHRLGRSLRQQLRTATGTASTAYQPLQDADSGGADDDDNDSGDVELRTVASMV